MFHIINDKISKFLLAFFIKTDQLMAFWNFTILNLWSREIKWFAQGHPEESMTN